MENIGIEDFFFQLYAFFPWQATTQFSTVMSLYLLAASAAFPEFWLHPPFILSCVNYISAYEWYVVDLMVLWVIDN